MDFQWLQLQFQTNPERTKVGLARHLGLEPPAISKILSGTRQIKAAEYIAMRSYFGLPNEDAGQNSARHSTSYKLESFEQPNGLSETSQETNADEWVIPAHILNQRTSARPDQIKIFEIQERLMEPKFKLGESLLVDVSDHTPSPAGVFILHDGFGYMVRFCEFIPKSYPAEIRISANHADFIPHALPVDDLDVIGRVIAKLQMV